MLAERFARLGSVRKGRTLVVHLLHLRPCVRLYVYDKLRSQVGGCRNGEIGFSLSLSPPSFPCPLSPPLQ